jgi:preprotein translocase subunit SecA
MLRRKGIPHAVLNAKYHAKEAEIIAQAGRRGAVTVATNMAGRGTDILLGGNPEFLATSELRNRGLDPVEGPEEYEAALIDAIPRWKKQCDEEADEVVDAGGLYVLGTERHDARRIDNQLRGRSGRQGDPGESRFYLSLQDELMKRFRAAAVEALMDRFNIPEDVPMESKLVTRQIRSAQTQIEAQNAEIRKDVLKYDEVLNKQRLVIYAERRRVLDGEDVHEQIQHMIDDTIAAYVGGATAGGYTEDWDHDQLWSSLKQLYPVGITFEEIQDEAGGSNTLDSEFLTHRITEDAHEAYERREEELSPEVLRELERQVLLQVIDRKWREHLYEMDYLREGVALRAYAQRDPLVEYQREGFDMFTQMMEGVKEEAVGFLFNFQPEPAPEPEVAAAPVLLAGKGISPAAQRRQQALLYSAPSIDGESGAGAPVLVQDAGLSQAAPARNGRTGNRRTPGSRSGSPATRAAAARAGSPSATASPAQPATGPVDAPSAPRVGGSAAASARLGNGAGMVARGSSPGEQAANRLPAPGQATGSEPSRNGPCPCGSGKKYKRCHGAPNA